MAIVPAQNREPTSGGPARSPLRVHVVVATHHTGGRQNLGSPAPRGGAIQIETRGVPAFARAPPRVRRLSPATCTLPSSLSPSSRSSSYRRTRRVPGSSKDSKSVPATNSYELEQTGCGHSSEAMKVQCKARTAGSSKSTRSSTPVCSETADARDPRQSLGSGATQLYHHFISHCWSQRR